MFKYNPPIVTSYCNTAAAAEVAVDMPGHRTTSEKIK